jgi:hypothetical protein
LLEDASSSKSADYSHTNRRFHIVNLAPAAA